MPTGLISPHDSEAFKSNAVATDGIAGHVTQLGPKLSKKQR